MRLVRNTKFIVTFFCFTFLIKGIASAQNHEGEGNLKYVNPTIGNVGHLLVPTRPTVQLPNEMMRMYPKRTDYIDDQISAFPLIVVSHRLGEAFSIKPSNKSLSASSWKSKMTYDVDLEINRPWYYETYLIDEDITVKYVPGKKVGFFKFIFPETGERNLLLDVINKGINEFKFISNNEVIGVETYHDNIKVYLYGMFSDGATKGTIIANKVSKGLFVSEEQSKAWISFPSNVKEVDFKYAISYISQEQAKKNYQNELAKTNFNDLDQAGEKAWSKVINQIQTTGGTDAQKSSFYTALYRCNERMVDINEDGQYFSGFDNKIHQSKQPAFVDDWTWDTYLAQHPLNILLTPSKEEAILNSYVNMYTQSGWMPTFPVLFGDHACMNGFHSSVMFLDAYKKGLKNFDLNKAYEGMHKNATEATMIPWRNGPKGPLDDFYLQNGYFPALKIGEKETVDQVDGFEKRQAVAVTLGHSYDDWAVGELATALKKVDDAVIFGKRALNYKKLWEPSVKLFMPKDSQGNWVSIDPGIDGGPGGREYYDENNGYTYTWQVQHDIPGLIDLFGGKAEFESQLDYLFRQPLNMPKTAFWYRYGGNVTGLVGQFAMGNEPSFHIPYLYNFTNSPWKTQKKIRFLLETWFKDNEFGVPGDEDGGGMSAFVVFSSMGFYPITPGKPIYTIASPIFENISIQLTNGKTFQLVAKNSSKVNKYIQSAKMNGKELTTPWFTHDQLINGGKLELIMGPKPNKTWGIEK